VKHRRIVVLGGSGFIGRHLVAALAADEAEVVVVTRARDHAKHLSMLPRVEIVEADAQDATDVAVAARGADALINLVGILHSTRGMSFDDIHVGVAEAAIRACRSNRIRRLLHMSALNADPNGPSAYLRSKGEAEAKVRSSGLQWTIFRPSVVFGPEDQFLNKFAPLVRWFPVIPLAGASARFQPIYVGDVVTAFASALEADETIGQSFGLCGPRVYTLGELMAYTGSLVGRRPLIVGLPGLLGQAQAALLELVPGKPMSRDNLASMRVDSVCGAPYPAVLGGPPRALEAIAPGYLSPAAEVDRFASYRSRRR
jgi:NADH dehydrogenase